MDTINRVQDVITASASELRSRVNDTGSLVRSGPTMVYDSTMEHVKQLKEQGGEIWSKHIHDRISPYSEFVMTHYNNVRSVTDEFIDNRLSETDVNPDTSAIDKYKALTIAIYKWIIMQIAVLSRTIMDKALSAKDDVSKEYVDGTLAFYVQWMKVLIFSLYQTFVVYLPIDQVVLEKKIESMKSEYFDPLYNSSSEVIRGVVTKGRDVADRYEPLRDAILERGAKVEARVKRTALGELLGNRIASLKRSGSEGECDPSDTTEASPAAKRDNIATTQSVTTN